ncbi:hypothetical protein WJX77_000424 [Trebouxia sp. C0004]
MEKQGVVTEFGQQKLQNGLWQSIQDRISEQTGHSLQDDVVPTHFMQHILAPGVLSQQALSHALLELDEPLARYNASMPEVQQHLTAAAQGIVAREKCCQLTSWHRVVQTYWKHWAELHRAVGLVELPHGTIAIVRSGHMLTLLQKADPLSASQPGVGISADVSPAHPSQTGDLGLLLQCVELLQQLLGQDVVARSSDQPQASADTRDTLRHWRGQRSAAILNLGHLISQMSQGTPVPALRDYITHIGPAAASAGAMSTQSAAQLAPSAGHALTIMLRQIATQQLQSASFMLLLAWLDSLRAAGALHITAAVSNTLKQEIAPQLQAHIRCTSITLWLCTAPAAALAHDEAARLNHSELSTKLASLDFVSGGKQQAHHQQSLAELFLPDFAAHCEGVSLGHEPHVAVSALASYFQASCGQPTVSSSLTGSTVVQQVIAVGQKLIHLHQVPHMHHLLALAGEAADTPGAAFLRGYAGLQQAQNSTSDEQGKQAVQIAVGNLFQAMAVFHTANQPTQYGQQKDLTDSCNMIKHIIYNILMGLTGSCDRPGPQGEELQYLTALMMQSEHWGWPQAAASFAQAAMRQIEVVYSQDNAPESDADRADWTAQRQNQESMFCANLFVYALEGGQYQDAYTAVQANPVAHVALGTLQRLVNTLINTSNIATLCSLPYATDYTVSHSDGRFEILSLLQVTQELLEQRAASADLNSQPQLYDVLYDFYCMRSNFKAAAAAQYTLACRLRDEAKHVPHCLHRRAAALLLSATALSMVEPSQRWLLNPAPLLQSLRSPQPFITPPTPSSDPSTTALSRCKAGIAHSIVVLTGDSSQALGSKCQYTDLTQEHAAAHAHALLARLQPDAEPKPTVPDDVFHQALALGLFQVAFSLAAVVYHGQRLSLALQAAISTMVTACVQKQMDSCQADSMALPSSAPAFGQASSSQELRPDFEDLSAAAAWHVVMDSLQQHETPRHKHCLHLTAVRAALGKERRLKLPAALLAPFQAPAPVGDLTGMAGRGPDPAALLSAYLQYDRLTDAADLVLGHLAAYQKADPDSRQGHCKVWFPFRIMKNLMTRLGKNVSLQEKYSLLQAALQQHQGTAFSMSTAFQGTCSDEVAVMEE